MCVKASIKMPQMLNLYMIISIWKKTFLMEKVCSKYGNKSDNQITTRSCSVHTYNPPPPLLDWMSSICVVSGKAYLFEVGLRTYFFTNSSSSTISFLGKQYQAIASISDKLSRGFVLSLKTRCLGSFLGFFVLSVKKK